MTIIFKDDWNKVPSAIVDTQTKNKSFLRYSALLKEMGIKNHAFPLQLHDRELQGVDPFDYDNLSPTMMGRIAVECKVNFYYYVREIVRVPGSGYENPLMYKANRGNMALFWLFFNHITQILIQPRQTGKSFSVDVLDTNLINMACTGTTINLLTKDDTLRTSNLDRLKNIELELPYYLRQRKKTDIANTEEIRITSLDNKYKGHLPNRSPKLALNVGRGLTSPLFRIDEAAFFANIAISLPAALAAGTAARDLAKIKGEPYGIIMTTTAGKKDDRDGRYVYNLLQNSAVWTEKFFDCANEKELYEMVRRNAPRGELRVNCTFNHRQLGYTDEWLKEAMETAISEGEDAERDFLCRWTSGSTTSPLSKELTEKIRDSQVNDYHTEISSPYGYVTRWYIPEVEIMSRMSVGHYIMGLDTSDAAGGDDIAMVLREVRSGDIIAAGNYNETNLITFAEWICSWIEKFPNITVIIERRSTGSMIIDYLLLMLPSKNIDPFTRLYNKAVHEADQYGDRYKEITKPIYTRTQDFYTKYKKLFGFATSGTGTTSRTELYSVTLLNAAKMTGDKVRDPKTIDQILGLEVKNGRVDHGEGSHDDMVIAWMLSFWLMSQGKNLGHYGINSREILMDNRVNKEINDPMAVYERREQDYLRREVESLVEQLVNEHDEYASMILERKLRLTANKLNETDKETLSMDELIGNIKDSKRMNARNRMRYY